MRKDRWFVPALITGLCVGGLAAVNAGEPPSRSSRQSVADRAVGSGAGEPVVQVGERSSDRPAWSVTLGGMSTDQFLCVQETNDGGYVVAGAERSWGNGMFEGWVVKLSSSGTKTWSSTFGGTADDRFYSVRQTTDHGYILAGFEGSWGNGSNEAWLVKLDAAGSKGWSKTFGGSQDDRFQEAQQTSDGGYIVAGYEGSWGQGSYDAWVMKLDSSGNKTWSKTFGGAGDDEFHCVRETSDGGYILAGQEGSWGLGEDDAWLVKLDGSGAKVWSHTFGGVSGDWFDSVRETSDGGYIVAGSEASWGHPDPEHGGEGWAIKLSSSGTK